MTIERTGWVDKVWGKTKCVARGPNFEVHHIQVNQGFRCSRHRHLKWNSFYVVSGELWVQLYSRHPQTNELEETTAFLVKEGDTYDVIPGIWHRFESRNSPAVAMEVYWTERISADDIERADEGGSL